MSTYRVRAVPIEARRGTLDPLEMELETLVSCHVGAGIESYSSGRAASVLTAESSLQPYFIFIIINFKRIGCWFSCTVQRLVRVGGGRILFPA